VDAISDAQVKAHFGPKPPPLPKEKVPEAVVKHFVDNAQPPAVKERDSGYVRSIKQSYRARSEKNQSSSSSSQALGQKKEENCSPAGRTGSAIGPPLIVQTHAPIDDQLITDDLRRQAKEAGVSIEALLGFEEFPKFKEEELHWKYARGKPLVRPEQIPLLPTNMYKLHDWYMRVTKEHDRESLMVNVKPEHYFHGKALSVEYTEFYHLFNRSTLDISILCSYCL
jgi:hypothetical protein